jgi:hypothetical protein
VGSTLGEHNLRNRRLPALSTLPSTIPCPSSGYRHLSPLKPNIARTSLSAACFGWCLSRSTRAAPVHKAQSQCYMMISVIWCIGSHSHP